MVFTDGYATILNTFVTFRVTMYLCRYDCIHSEGLRLLWEKDDPSKLPAPQLEKIRRILMALDTVKALDTLRQIPGYKLHALTGNLKGFWSVTLTGNYRIIFRFENENVYDVNYIDYH